jgi:nicotinamide riboside transporter PnuC
MEMESRILSIMFIIFWITFVYILVKIGLRRFKFYDIYKIIIPVYLIIYIRKYRNIKSIAIGAINIISIFIWYFFNFVFIG